MGGGGGTNHNRTRMCRRIVEFYQFGAQKGYFVAIEFQIFTNTM